MNSKKNKKKLFIILLLLTVLAPGLHAQRTKSSLSAGEQRFAEKGLKDNRYFFYFINSSVSNLGSEKEKKIFKEAIQRDMIAQILYMKFSFHDSFVEIRKAQKLLIDLYRQTLKRDIATTKTLLNSFAPEIINKNKRRPRHYLSLGYRDAAVARQYLVMADNYRETLYSLRLYKYVKAIKRAKHGKRYAFLAALESKQLRVDSAELKKEVDKLYREMHSMDDSDKKMKEYRHRIYEAKLKVLKAKRELGYLSFDELGELITKISSDKKDFYTLLHHDNYYMTKDGKSFFDLTWDKPELEEIKEYNEYPQKY